MITAGLKPFHQSGTLNRALIFPQVAELPAGNVGQGALSGCSEILLYGSSGDAERKGGAKGCVLS